MLNFLNSLFFGSYGLFGQYGLFPYSFDNKSKQQRKALRSERIKQIEQMELSSEDSVLDFTLNFAKENYKMEEERLNKIEQKTTVFLGFSTVIFSTALLFIGKDLPVIRFFDKIILFLGLFYLLGSMIFCLKVLDRDVYSSLDIQDYKHKNLPEMIKKLELYAYENWIVINKKVDYMSSSHYWFRNFLVSSTIFLLATQIRFEDFRSNVFSMFNFLNIKNYIIFSLILVIFITTVFILKRI